MCAIASCLTSAIESTTSLPTTSARPLTVTPLYGIVSSSTVKAYLPVAAMFRALRLSAWVWMWTRSSSTANQIGTTCRSPAADTVASRPSRVSSVMNVNTCSFDQLIESLLAACRQDSRSRARSKRAIAARVPRLRTAAWHVRRRIAKRRC
jgi:hypothetical protein